MFIKRFKELPNHYQGIFYIACGTIVLLYALGIIQTGVSFVVIGVAVCAIAVGAQKLGLLDMVWSFNRRIFRHKR